MMMMETYVAFVSLPPIPRPIASIAPPLPWVQRLGMSNKSQSYMVNTYLTFPVLSLFSPYRLGLAINRWLFFFFLLRGEFWPFGKYKKLDTQKRGGFQDLLYVSQWTLIPWEVFGNEGLKMMLLRIAKRGKKHTKYNKRGKRGNAFR